MTSNPSSPARRPRPSLAAMTALGLLLLTLVFFYRFFRGDLVFRDPLFEFYPLRLLWGYALTGELPLWNPYVGVGMPLSGSVYPAVFYPLHGLLLYLLHLPANLSIRVFTLAHYWLAAVGMFYLARTLGTRREAALTSAVAYAFSGYLVSMHYAQNLLPGMALCPLVIGLMLRARATGRPFFATTAGALTGLIFLGGDPQGFALTVALSLAAAIFLAPAGAAPMRPGRALALTALFIGIATAGAAAELVPALSVFRASPRAEGFDLAAAGYWSFHPARVLQFFLAQPWGKTWPVNHYWPVSAPMEFSPYVGIWALITAGIALRWSRLRADRRAQFFAAVAVVFLFLSFGRHFPLFGLVLKIPGADIFRFPEKYLYQVTLALAVLSGLGVEQVLSTPAEAGPRSRLYGLWPGPALAAAGAVVFAVIAFTLDGPLGRLLLSRLPDANWGLVAPETAARVICLSVVRAVALLGAGWWLLGRLRRSPGARPALAGALFLFVDLFIAHASLAPTDPELYRHPSKLAGAILEREGLGPAADDVPCCAVSPFRLRAPLGRFRVLRPNNIDFPLELCRRQADGRWIHDQRETLRWMRDTIKPNLGVMDGLENFDGISAAMSGRFTRLRNEVFTLDQAAVFNVKYAIVPAANETAAREMGTVLERFEGVVLVELNGVFPRAYWIGAERVLAEGVELDRALATNDFSRRVIIAPGPEPLPPLPPQSGGGIVPARMEQYSLNRVEVEVTAPAAGWLVLSDADFPGWRAWVDGRPATIHRANGLVRAVRMEAGRHQVVFTYRPPGLRAGVFASALAFLAAAGLAVTEYFPRSKSEAR